MKVAGGLVIGMLTAIMVSLNGLLSTYVELYNSALIVHLVGLITVAIILLFFVRNEYGTGKRPPLYFYFVGLCGVLMVVLTNVCFQSVGVALTVATGLLGQSILSSLIDHFGLFGMPRRRFTLSKLPGLLLILAGTLVMIIY